jgi:hypothetical protein
VERERERRTDRRREGGEEGRDGDKEIVKYAERLNSTASYLSKLLHRVVERSPQQMQGQTEIQRQWNETKDILSPQ